MLDSNFIVQNYYAELEDYLRYAAHSEKPTVVIGEAGCGKTTFALWLVKKNPDSFTYIDVRDFARKAEWSNLIYELAVRRDSEKVALVDGLDFLHLDGSSHFVSDLLEADAQYPGPIHAIFFSRPLSRSVFSGRRGTDPATPLNLNSFLYNALRFEARLWTSEIAEIWKNTTGSYPPDSIIQAFLSGGYNKAILVKMTASLFQANPSEAEKLLLGTVFQDDSSPTQLFSIASKVETHLLDDILVRPEVLHTLQAREFEELIAMLLKKEGYETNLTKRTRDGGFDMYAYKESVTNNGLFLVEAKRKLNDKPLSVRPVRELYGVMNDRDATGAMLVTTGTFSPDAHDLAKKHKHRLTLRDYQELVTWIHRIKGI